MNFIFTMAARRHHRVMRNLSARSFKKKMLQTLGAFSLLFSAHTGAMMKFENMSVGDAAWLTATTATTVGYGDLSAKSLEGRLATALLMYGAGIFVLAQAAGTFFDYRQDRREQLIKGKWSWKMKDHIVVLNAPQDDPERYFKTMIGEMRKSELAQGQKPILLVTNAFPDGLSDDLRTMNVAHVHYNPVEEEGHEKSNIAHASTIVVIARDPADPRTDSVTFDLVSRAREQNPNARIIAEVVESKNFARIKKAGANNVLAPMHNNPNVLSRTILAPGTEQVLSDIADSGNEEMVRYDIQAKGRWIDIQMALGYGDVGTVISYEDASGDVISHQHPFAEVETAALLVLVRKGNDLPVAEVQRRLNNGLNAAPGVGGPLDKAFRRA